MKYFEHANCYVLRCGKFHSNSATAKKLFGNAIAAAQSVIFTSFVKLKKKTLKKQRIYKAEKGIFFYGKACLFDQ